MALHLIPRSRQTRDARRDQFRIESLEARLTMSADFADSIAAAPVFDASVSFLGRIGDGAWRRRDVDLAGFTMAAGGTLTVDLDARSLAGGSRLDGYLRVFDAAGRVVASNDDYEGSLDSYISLTVPQAGTYYVGVSGFGNDAYRAMQPGSGRAGSTGRYSVTVSVDNPPAIDTAGDTTETARDVGTIAGSRTLRESIGGGDASDVFRFTLTERARVGLRLDGLASDADLVLIDPSGQWITTSTQGGTTADLIEQELRPGTYFAEVRPFEGSTNYTLTLSSQTVWPTFATPEYRSDTGWGFVDAAAAVAMVRGHGMPLPEVPYRPDYDFGIDLVNAPAVWAQGFTGAGVVVAVIDTGVDYNHEDLRQNIWVNPREIPGDNVDNDRNGFVDDVRGWDFIDNDATPMDVVDTSRDWLGNRGNAGHGTHVAGTIAAARNGIGSTGVAPDARIMPIRVFSQRNFTSQTIIARGIRYAADNGAHVINMSLGGGAPSSEIELAILHATSRGCVVVISAGNDLEATPTFPAHLAATIDGVIAVGATRHDRSLTNFSHRAGPDSRMQYVTAPGEFILSTLPGNAYGSSDGTSMAAPHVAGVAALMRSALPTGNEQRYWTHITGTARQQNVTATAMATLEPASFAGVASPAERRVVWRRAT